MELKPGKILICEGEIARRVEELAAAVNGIYGGAPVMLVGVLDGCLIFLSDLIRRLEMPIEIALVRVKTYGASTRPQKKPAIAEEDLSRIPGRNVLIVDDISDSGATLAALLEAFRAAGARSVRACVLLEKDRSRERPVKADLVGFKIPDVFVVGYGLDYAGKYRNLPYVAALEGFDGGPVIA